jgi:hypothetical protein
MGLFKVGSLKCRIVQTDGSGLEITLNEVKFVPGSWVLEISLTFN